jgi:hypothetical protein
MIDFASVGDLTGQPSRPEIAGRQVSSGPAELIVQKVLTADWQHQMQRQEQASRSVSSELAEYGHCVWGYRPCGTSLHRIRAISLSISRAEVPCESRKK